MRTKTSNRTGAPFETRRAALAAPAFPDTVSYWLEDDLGHRVSKLFASSERLLMLAGRVLDNVGSLAGWTIARRDSAGLRHVVASDADLEAMATPFMPVRTPAEAVAMGRFHEAQRDIGFRRANIVTDERVY